jgi:putative membrane protein
MVTKLIWSTQSDMALALLGAIISIIVLAKYHDRQLAKISVIAAN